MKRIDRDHAIATEAEYASREAWGNAIDQGHTRGEALIIREQRRDAELMRYPTSRHD